MAKTIREFLKEYEERHENDPPPQDKEEDYFEELGKFIEEHPILCPLSGYGSNIALDD